MKKDFTREELKELGFELTKVNSIESGGDPYDYYTMDFDGFSFITDEFTEGVSKAKVQIFNASLNRNLSEEFIRATIKEFKK